MELELEKLNKEQKEAVVFGNGPLLIVAGAGTGKTTVITKRIAYLIHEKLAKPEEILAVTFTNKAAEEMEDRVDRLLDFGYMDLWISTFHSFAERILRENALDIGLSSDFKLLDQTSAWLLVRQNLDKFNLDYYKPMGNPTKFIHSLISHFSKCKDQGIYPKDYLEYAEKLKTNLTDLPEQSETERIKEVASAFHFYQKLLLDNNALDFGDVINFCLTLFKKRPHILKKYREKFKYILVDEFQDTNWAQYELVRVLAEPKNNLTVCADDDQSVYAWRSASYNNIIQFKKDFKNVKEVFLVKNYRSTQDILDLAYNFIQANNPDRLESVSKLDKKLISNTTEKGEIEHLHFTTLTKEADGVVQKIADVLKQDKEASYSDFAILVRANDYALPFMGALERAGIPYQFLASRGLYSKPIILDVISYFKLLDNYHESSAVFRVLNMGFLEIPQQDIMKIARYAEKTTKSMYEALQELPLIQGFNQQTTNKLNFISGLIKQHTSQAQSRNVSELFTGFLKDTGYLKFLSKQEKTIELDLLQQFYSKIEKFEDSSIEPNLRNFMEQINLELESGEQGGLEFDPNQGPDMVKIMTIHSAKGLEFRYVFLINLVDRRFPSSHRKELIEIPDELIKEIKPEGDAHLQEERRLCYVCLTRAKKGLFLTSADNYGTKQTKKLSRFLLELGFKKKQAESKAEKKAEANNSEFEKSKLAERQKAKPFFVPDHFSFSQLSAFSKCPLQYKYSQIFKGLTKGKAVFSFGTTIHNTLYEFVKSANKQAGVQQGFFGDSKITASDEAGRSPAPTGAGSFEDLIKLYDKKWVDEWYDNKEQKAQYRKLGKQILKDFYNKFIKNRPKIAKIGQDLGLEYGFRLKLNGNTLVGRIDRIDQLENGVALIDYKTGKSKEKLDSDSKLQLILYQIAVEQALNLNPVELKFCYLEDGSEISFLASAQEKQETKQAILDEITAIKNSDFKPTPGWHCQFCDFLDICDFAKR